MVYLAYMLVVEMLNIWLLVEEGQVRVQVVVEQEECFLDLFLFLLDLIQ